MSKTKKASWEWLYMLNNPELWKWGSTDLVLPHLRANTPFQQSLWLRQVNSLLQILGVTPLCDTEEAMNGRYGKTLTMKHPSTLNLASGMAVSVLSFKKKIKRIQTALTLLSGLSTATLMATPILLGHLYSRINAPYPLLLVFCTQKKGESSSWNTSVLVRSYNGIATTGSKNFFGGYSLYLHTFVLFLLTWNKKESQDQQFSCVLLWEPLDSSGTIPSIMKIFFLIR